MFVAAAAPHGRQSQPSDLGALQRSERRQITWAGAGPAKSEPRLHSKREDEMQKWLDQEVVRRMKKIETQMDSMSLRVINFSEELAVVANATMSRLESQGQLIGKGRSDVHFEDVTRRNGHPVTVNGTDMMNSNGSGSVNGYNIVTPQRSLNGCDYDHSMTHVRSVKGLNSMRDLAAALPPPSSPSKWSVNFTQRSTTSLPLPIGDKLVVGLDSQGAASDSNIWPAADDGPARMTSTGYVLHEDSLARRGYNGHLMTNYATGHHSNSGALSSSNEASADGAPICAMSSMQAHWDQRPALPEQPGAVEEPKPQMKKGVSRASLEAVSRTVAAMEARAMKRNRTMKAVWEFLDDADSSAAAAFYAAVTPWIIMVSIVVAVMETVESETWLDNGSIHILEVIFDCYFILEFALRLTCCPSKRLFFYNYNHIIDAAACLPLVLRAIIGFDAMGRQCDTFWCTLLLGTVPFVRSMKSLRRFDQLRLIIEAFQLAYEGLPICLFTLSVLTISFASLIYLLEERSNIYSLPHSMWFTIVTMTTVGYGDITPKSIGGHLVVSVLVVFSVLYMAIPLGIVGNAFTQVWQNRDFILLRHKVKVKFSQWGYGAEDFATLFKLFDSDQDGELCLSEFLRMMESLHIGLGPDRAIQLFEVIDVDGSGFVDDHEFVKAVFPKAHRMMYNSDGTRRGSQARLELERHNSSGSAQELD